MVKEFLSQRGIPFEERDVSLNRAYAQELVRSTGQMGVPVTVINGQVVVGFDQRRLEQVIVQSKTTQRPSFGASVADASKITGQRAGAIRGAFVGKVRAGSAAERAGLVAGDIIIELNNKSVMGAGDLEYALSGLNPGNRFSIVFVRDSRTVTSEGIL